MSDQPPDRDAEADPGGRISNPPSGGRATPPATEPTADVPRWVKVFAIIGIALLVFVVISLLSGHGPNRHGAASPNTSAATQILALGGRA